MYHFIVCLLFFSLVAVKLFEKVILIDTDNFLIIYDRFKVFIVV